MSPKSKKQFEIIRSQSRENIMQTALELFARKGYFNTSIQQIAKEAGISKGLLYNYFKSKEELLRQIIFEAVAVGEEIVEKELNADYDPKQQLKNIIDFSFSWVQQNTDYWRLLASLSFQTEVISEFEEMLKAKSKGMIAQTEALMQRMGYSNPKMEAYAVGAMLDGIMLHYINMIDDYPFDEMKDYLTQKYCS